MAIGHHRPITPEELAAFSPETAAYLVEMHIQIDESPEHMLTDAQLDALNEECDLIEAIEDAESASDVGRVALLRALYEEKYGEPNF